MDIKLAKKDFWLAILAGEVVVWLSLPTLKNLKILDLLLEKKIDSTMFIAGWAIIIPLGAIAGLFFFYFIAKWKERIGFLQLGKYGIIGVLNTFLNAGIYNFLIFVTNISAGFRVDLFFVVSFLITVTNSFFWNRYWTFKKEENGTLKTEALRFFTVSIIVALINTGILHFIINIVGPPYNIEPKIWANVALFFTIITAFFGNFFGYKFIVFKKQAL